MRASKALVAVALAFGLVAAPAPVDALDLGKSVRDTTRSLSKTTRDVTRSLSRTVSSTTKSVGSTVGSTTKSVGSTVGSTTKSVTSTVGSTTKSVTSTVGSVGETTLSTTSDVLSSFQLSSLGLESNPSVPGEGTGGGVTPAYVRALVSDLNRIEKQALEIRCASVLRSPKAFDAELILLCQILASISQTEKGGRGSSQ